MGTSKAAAAPKGVTKTASLLPCARLGTNKGDGSLCSEIVFIVYIELRREGLVSLVIAGISETCFGTECFILRKLLQNRHVHISSFCVSSFCAAIPWNDDLVDRSFRFQRQDRTLSP